MLLANLVLALLASAYGYPGLESPESREEKGPSLPNNYDFYIPEPAPYRTYQLLQPRVPSYQYPRYTPPGIQQQYPGGPEIILYHGSPYPESPFGFAPPGTNFLVPQPGPNVVRNTPPRPIFVAGYPKPAHIPPIEKDAEEVPTNPSKIPPLARVPETRPEKLETFNEDDSFSKPAADPKPVNPFYSLRPDQRFFTLNGQPLYNIYSHNQYQLYDPAPEIPKTPINVDDLSFYSAGKQPVDKAQPRDNFEQDDSVVIDLGERENDANSDSEVVAAAGNHESEQPTISQAQPGAIALAGPGGVAAAAPRGTAFVGKGGVAVSSPRATAVAGPAKGQITEEEEEKDEEKKKKKKQ